MTKVFIDGSHGTTGLKIKNRLDGIAEYQVIECSFEERKVLEKRIELANSADVTILCLPDAAALEIMPHLTGTVIDTSTAHRTNDDFAYGFAEIGFREKIKASSKIANPGCHVTGYLSIVCPLKSVISKELTLACNSITGYSGGGNAMIADYQNPEREAYLAYPRQYGLNLTHKHLKEMKKFSSLQNAPVFSPIVADFYSGMAVSVPLDLASTGFKAQDIVDIYKEFYKEEALINVHELNNHPAITGGFMNPAYKSNLDNLDIVVCGNDEQVVIFALFDNLGKGASGSAIQCLNIKSGNDETLGLKL